MGIIANIKAIRDVQKIKKGGTAYFTISAITNLIINLADARKLLDSNTFDKVFQLYKRMNKCKSKMELDFNGYLAVAADILYEFDQIAPCEYILGVEPFEARMLMNEVRKTQQTISKKEQLMNQLYQLRKDMSI